jgi:hypothetical protein
MGKKGRKKKEMIPFFLVQYHQYQKCISFARARDLLNPKRKKDPGVPEPRLRPAFDLFYYSNHEWDRVLLSLGDSRAIDRM